MIYELRYVPRENAPRVAGSRYDSSFAFAKLETETDDVDQSEELALRFYRKNPPADLEFWCFDFPTE